MPPPSPVFEDDLPLLFLVPVRSESTHSIWRWLSETPQLLTDPPDDAIIADSCSACLALLAERHPSPHYLLSHLLVVRLPAGTNEKIPVTSVSGGSWSDGVLVYHSPLFVGSDPIDLSDLCRRFGNLACPFIQGSFNKSGFRPYNPHPSFPSDVYLQVKPLYPGPFPIASLDPLGRHALRHTRALARRPRPLSFSIPPSPVLQQSVTNAVASFRRTRLFLLANHTQPPRTHSAISEVSITSLLLPEPRWLSTQNFPFSTFNYSLSNAAEALSDLLACRPFLQYLTSTPRPSDPRPERLAPKHRLEILTSLFAFSRYLPTIRYIMGEAVFPVAAYETSTFRPNCLSLCFSVSRFIRALRPSPKEIHDLSTQYPLSHHLPDAFSDVSLLAGIPPAHPSR